MCDFLGFFFPSLGVVVWEGKKEPTKPLCGSLLTPARVPCLLVQDKLNLGVMAGECSKPLTSKCEGNFAGFVDKSTNSLSTLQA